MVAGQVNLIDPDPTEKRESVFRVIPYETYNNVTRKDDIALIEVRYIIKLQPQKLNQITFTNHFTFSYRNHFYLTILRLA